MIRRIIIIFFVLLGWMALLAALMLSPTFL